MKNQERETLRQLWRKAQLEGRLELPCGTAGEARRVRMALYSAVRAVREGKEPADRVLQQAVEDLMIGLKEGEPGVLVMMPRTGSKLMQLAAAVLGVLPAKTTEELAMEESSRRLMAELEAAGQAPEPAPEPTAARTTPYYTREG